MVMDRTEEIQRWWDGLASHIAPVYFSQQHHQIDRPDPLLLDLLEWTGMPGLTNLALDLQRGFQTGPGWLPGAD